MAEKIPAGVLAKLLKIQQLAEAGVDGERANAAGLLERLMLRHGLTLDELAGADQPRQRYTFNAPKQGPVFQLLVQIWFRLAPDSVRQSNGQVQVRSGAVTLELTAAEHAMVSHALAILEPQLRKELQRARKAAFLAFLEVNALFGQPAPDVPIQAPTAEQRELWRRANALAKGMKRTPVHPAIEGRAE